MEGFVIDIVHNRRYKTASFSTRHGVTVKTIERPKSVDGNPLSSFYMEKLLAKGGSTEVIAFHKPTETKFTAKSICHEKDNFDKTVGTIVALNKLNELIEAASTEGFTPQEEVEFESTLPSNFRERAYTGSVVIE